MPYELNLEEAETLETYTKLARIWDDLATPHWKDKNWFSWLSYIPEGGRGLDIGCGTARDARLFLDDNVYYVGIDFSEEMLAVARKNFAEQIKKGMVEFHLMNMCALDFPPESFDAFWSVTSFMHVSKVKLPVALREAYRVLKTKGVGFISIPHGTFNGMYSSKSHDGGRTLSVCWLKEEFSVVLQDAGFKVLSMEVFAHMIFCLVQKA